MAAILDEETLLQQLKWYQRRLKPYLAEKSLEYWSKNPAEYEQLKGVETWLIRELRALREA